MIFHTVEYYRAKKKIDKLLPYTTAWMYLENIMSNVRGHTQKSKKPYDSICIKPKSR